MIRILQAYAGIGKCASDDGLRRATIKKSKPDRNRFGTQLSIGA